MLYGPPRFGPHSGSARTQSSPLVSSATFNKRPVPLPASRHPDRSRVEAADWRSDCISDLSQICWSPKLSEICAYYPDAIEAIVLTPFPTVFLEGFEGFLQLLHQFR